jgi:uncharacterized protein (DUF1684 family)
MNEDVTDSGEPAEGETGPALSTAGYMDLWDWRRRVADLYAEVRAREPEAAWRHWRTVRDRLFGEHPQSPLDPSARAGFSGLPFFDYDPALRLVVELGAPRDRTARRMGVGRDGTLSLLPFAETRGLGPMLGAELTLYWIAGYGGGVFLPFGDAGNGAEAYAGGRYLLDTIKGADLGLTPDGRAILDFNFAYNPSCAYSAEWVCPLAPPGNRLPVAVRAGARAPPA